MKIFIKQYRYFAVKKAKMTLKNQIYIYILKILQIIKYYTVRSLYNHQVHCTSKWWLYRGVTVTIKPLYKENKIKGMLHIEKKSFI